MHPSRAQFLYAALILSSTTACEGILGLSEFRAQQAQHAQSSSDAGASGCKNHAQCPLSGDAESATYCTHAGKCAALRGDGCNVVTGPEGDADAILIGSIFGTSGAEAANNRARQNAVVLAVEEINAAGGVPAPDHGQAGAARKLLLVACDASDPLRAAGHLVDLGALAIVGPDASQDMIDISMKRTIGSGVMLISPSATTDSIDDLLDADLDWLLAPTVEQRAPLMLRALDDIEAELSSARTHPLKLGVVFRDDALGRSTLTSLQSHRFADQTLSAGSDRVHIDRYDPAADDRAQLVDSYRKFAPDIIVVVGMTESVSEFVAPLERSWDGSDRPYYLFTEASKVPALLALAQQRPDVRVRVRGVGATPTSDARPVYESFQNRYDARFGDGLSSASGVGAAYDGTYAIAYALSSIERGRESGIRVAQALRWLSLSDNFVSVGPVGMSTAFQKLSAGERVSALGTMNALQWDDNGSTRAGVLELWCIGSGEDGVRFAGSGLSLDVASRALQGSWTPCTTSSPGVMTHETGTSGQSGSNNPKPDETPSHEETKPGDAMQAGAPAPTQPSAGSGAAGMAPPQAGAGGMIMPPPAAGSGAPPRHTTNVACGSRSCSLQSGEHCCISVVRPLTGPEPQDLACRADSSTTGMCELALHCSSDTECAPGSVCCATEHSSVCMDASQCSALSARRLGCESSQDCPANTVCCIHITSDANTFVSTLCEAQCSPLQGGGRLCLNDGECQAVSNQLACKPSYVLPSVKVCWPAD